MTLLQQLIGQKLGEGKTYRQMGRECGKLGENSEISHVSLSKYHHGLAEPEGKNLAILAKYFRVDYWLLLEEVQENITDRRKSDPATPALSGSPEMALILKMLPLVSEPGLRAVLQTVLQQTESDGSM